MKGSLWAIVAGLLAWSSAPGLAAELPYRLAGILGSDQAWIALIEFPGGAYRLLRVGDQLEEGEVVAIAEDRLVIGLQNGEQRVVRMSGGEPAPLMPDEDTIRYKTTLTWFVDQPKLQRRIAKAREKLDAGKPAEFRAMLMAALRLPSHARIVAAGQTSIHSPQQLQSVLQETLDAGEGVLLSVAGVPGTEQLYLAPRPVAAPATVSQE